jgi:hypothetical protein
MGAEGVGWLKKSDWSLKTQAIPKRIPIRYADEEDSESEGPDDQANFRRPYINNLYDDYGETVNTSRVDIRQLDYVSRIAPVPTTLIPNQSKSLPSLSMYTRFGDRYFQKIADPVKDLTKEIPESVRFQEAGYKNKLMRLLRRPPLESFGMRKESRMATTF